ncbi:unnamed protein product [Ostreobium quekettii]|uniref:Uncharacterized protein n=1 Tax=Ostreobium quekettii TaxID=121088 RepID=A0A8S1IWW3_9CHLO|nr:unnamed protein product [Ostreobium quekettii]|eukprot:evm.model.scf_424.2 EVM.evm.TU.scf_424.2   scf_424:4788-5243(+)
MCRCRTCSSGWVQAVEAHLVPLLASSLAIEGGSDKLQGHNIDRICTTCTPLMCWVCMAGLACDSSQSSVPTQTISRVSPDAASAARILCTLQGGLDIAALHTNLQVQCCMRGVPDSGHEGYAGYQIQLGNGLVPRKPCSTSIADYWVAIIA